MTHQSAKASRRGKNGKGSAFLCVRAGVRSAIRFRSTVRSERTRPNGARTLAEMTSWGSLVRAQNRPLRPAYLSANGLVTRVVGVRAVLRERMVLSPVLSPNLAEYGKRAPRRAPSYAVDRHRSAGAASAPDVRSPPDPSRTIDLPHDAHRRRTGSEPGRPGRAAGGAGRDGREAVQRLRRPVVVAALDPLRLRSALDVGWRS